jgi:hypothetical protein
VLYLAACHLPCAVKCISVHHQVHFAACNVSDCFVCKYAACRGSQPSALPSRFAWLVGGLLLHGHLLLTELAGDASVSDGQEYVGDIRQLALAAGDGSPEDEPHALVSGRNVCSVKLVADGHLAM